MTKLSSEITLFPKPSKFQSVTTHKKTQNTTNFTGEFLKIPQNLIKTPYFLKYPRRLQTYLSLVRITHNGKKEIDRAVVLKLKKSLGLKYSQTWAHIRHLEKQKYIIRHASPPFQPLSDNFRRIVKFHRLLNPISFKFFTMLPVRDMYGISIFRKGFDIIHFISSVQTAGLPARFKRQALAKRTTQAYRTKRYNALIACQKTARDLILNNNIKETELQFFSRFKFLKTISLIQRKIPGLLLSVPFYETKKIHSGDKNFLAHKGVLYQKIGKQWVEYVHNSKCPPGLKLGYKHGNSIMLEKHISQGGSISQFRHKVNKGCYFSQLLKQKQFQNCTKTIMPPVRKNITANNLAVAFSKNKDKPVQWLSPDKKQDLLKALGVKK